MKKNPFSKNIDSNKFMIQSLGVKKECMLSTFFQPSKRYLLLFQKYYFAKNIEFDYTLETKISKNTIIIHFDNSYPHKKEMKHDISSVINYFKLYVYLNMKTHLDICLDFDEKIDFSSIPQLIQWLPKL
jgi:hypothetical protein